MGYLRQSGWPADKRIPDFRFSLLPGIDYSLLNQQRIKIWLTGQTGILWLHRGLEYFDTKERNKQQFAWQFWFTFEHPLNESLYLDWGIGYGTLGIVKIGISHSF